MPDAIPHGDEEFDTFINKLVTYIAGHATNLGVSTGMVTSLNAQLQSWSDDFADHQAKAAAALAATEVKNEDKEALTTTARAAIRIIQNNPAVTDEQRLLMGLPVRDTTRTRVPAPTTKPVVEIKTGQHFQQVLHWRDEAQPKSKAKPAGVRGAQIWMWVGANVPADPADFRWLALDSATPYLHIHDAGDAGKLAYYALRWENTHGETGPWSDVVSATVLG